MSDAEVLTVALVAMLYCGGNYAQARRWLGCRTTYRECSARASSPGGSIAYSHC